MSGVCAQGCVCPGGCSDWCGEGECAQGVGPKECVHGVSRVCVSRRCLSLGLGGAWRGVCVQGVYTTQRQTPLDPVAVPL